MTPIEEAFVGAARAAGFTATLFVLLGVVRRRPVDVRIEAVTHALGVLALLGMLVWISWGEIGKLLPRGSPSAPDASEARRPQ